MYQFNQHWGEIPASTIETKLVLAPADKEQIAKPRPMTVDGPRLHQPSSGEEQVGMRLLPAEYYAMDSLTLHTIKLLQYAKKMKALLHAAQQQQENLKNGEGEAFHLLPPAPPVPHTPTLQQKHTFRQPIWYMDKEFSPFVLGKGKTVPEIQGHTAQQILKKAVGTLCAHIGFDMTTEAVLETLTDIAQDYLQKITRLLRAAVDRETLTGSAGFPDAVERVCHEIGLGSVRNLHSFYQQRVICYHGNQMKLCQSLVEEYNALKHPDRKEKNDALHSNRFKEEVASEIHFPSSEDGEEPQLHMEHADTIHDLEPAMQMLQGLETSADGVLREDAVSSHTVKMEPQAQLHAFDPEEEMISVSDSPSQTNRDIAVQDPPSVTDTASPHSVGLQPARLKKRSDVDASVQDVSSVLDTTSPHSAGLQPSRPKKQKKK